MFNLISNINVREIARHIKAQDIKDIAIFGLSHMPTKTVAIALAAIESGAALYFTQPDTLIKQVSVIAITSSIAWVSTHASHKMACKLWKTRSNELEKEWNEYQKTPEAIESKRKMNEELDKLLDDFFENPEFLEKIGLNK